MTILGIDPGLKTIGFGIITQPTSKTWEVTRYGTIETKPSDPICDRLHTIYTNLIELLISLRPNAIGVEKLFFFRNQKTIMEVGQARGVILLACGRAQCPLFEPTPLQIKQSLTGYGNAPKKQVQAMIQQIFSLPSVPKPDDAADAIAIAYCTALLTHAPFKTTRRITLE